MDPIPGLALARIVLGASSFVSPALAAKVLMIDAGRNPQLSYMTRLFASREVLLGAITLASSGDVRRRLAGIGVAVDGADAFASLASTRAGAFSKPAGLLLTAGALGAVGAGVAGLNAARN